MLRTFFVILSFLLSNTLALSTNIIFSCPDGDSLGMIRIPDNKHSEGGLQADGAGVFYIKDNQLYIVDDTKNLIKIFDLATKQVKAIPFDNLFYMPEQLFVDNYNNIVVAQRGTGNPSCYFYNKNAWTKIPLYATFYITSISNNLNLIFGTEHEDTTPCDECEDPTIPIYLDSLFHLTTPPTNIKRLGKYAILISNRAILSTNLAHYREALQENKSLLGIQTSDSLILRFNKTELNVRAGWFSIPEFIGNDTLYNTFWTAPTPDRKPMILVYNRFGALISHFAEPDPAPFKYGEGITVSREGNIYRLLFKEGIGIKIIKYIFRDNN